MERIIIITVEAAINFIIFIYFAVITTTEAGFAAVTVVKELIK